MGVRDPDIIAGAGRIGFLAVLRIEARREDDERRSQYARSYKSNA